MADKEYTHNFRAPKELAWRKSYTKKPEITENYRSEFMRDRDRIMYCSSFRRLDGKTQIYRTGGNDHQRNRMTHTLEVAQLSRTIATALNLDSDLAEAIALGHDLGHAPFGHAGEEVLHRIMMRCTEHPIPSTPLSISEAGSSKTSEEVNFDKKLKVYLGFKHNIQSVRIITEIDNSYEREIEGSYENYGLDLTNFTLWGIMHHSDMEYDTNKRGMNEELKTCPYGDSLSSYMKHHDNEKYEAWSFEAFVVKQADEIAQWHHDLEDALRGNAMTSAEVCETVRKALGDHLTPADAMMLSELEEKKHIDKPYLTKFSHIVINTLVNWLIESSNENLQDLWDKQEQKVDKAFFCNPSPDDDVKDAISFVDRTDSKKTEENNKKEETLKNQFNDNIREKIHHSQPVERMNAKGKFVIEQLFKSYYAAPQQLPTSIIIQYLLDINKENEISDELKKEIITKKTDGESVEETVDVTIGQIISSWEKAWKAGPGAVRICFKKIWAEENILRKILLMRKICDHIAGMTDHFALEEYKNLYG